MAKKIYTVGLSKIEVGDIGENGEMGTILEVQGFTKKESCKMIQEEPEATEHYAEEVDDPVLIISRGGKIQFEYSLMNPSVAVMKNLLGGEANETENTWSAPDTIPVIEKSVRITPQQGLKFEIPRMRLESKINVEFSRNGILVIDVKGIVMQPTAEGVKKMTATLIS